jgi:hypothetical protein
MDNGATDAHLTSKLTGAHWLKQEGHDMATVPMDSSTGVPGYRYTPACLEQQVGSHRADVVCCCESDTVCVEAGYTPPDRLLKAFGIQYYDTLPIETDAKVEGAVHIAERSVDAFCVVPYRFGGMKERPPFEFRPGDIPAPDSGIPGRVASEVIGDYDVSDASRIVED